MAPKFQRIDALIKKIDLLADGQFHRDAIAKVIDTCHALALDALREHRNPRGRPWALIKATKLPSARLAALAAGSLREAIENMIAVRFSVSVRHAKAHQLGAHRGGKDLRSGAKLDAKALRDLSKTAYKELKPHLLRDTWRLPARSFLPKRGKLPPSWSNAISVEMRKLFGALWEQ